MFLSELEIQKCIAILREAFPRLSNWEFANERNEHYSGFTVWGECKPDPGLCAPTFFVTFDKGENQWAGHLSVGKPCYYWSSADAGDALLLGTERYASLPKAVVDLKVRIRSLAAIFLGPDAE